MNGFQEGMRKMYNMLLALNRTEKKKYKITEECYVEGDFIFKMIYKSNNVENIRYIEEILDCKLSKHYILTKNSSAEVLNSKIKELNERNVYFGIRDYEKNKEVLVKFFIKLLNEYQKSFFIDELKDKPLIYVVEDSQQLDSLSIRFISELLSRFKEKKINSMFLICTFQSLICDLKDDEKKAAFELNEELTQKFMDSGTIIELKPFMKTQDVSQLIKENIHKKLKDENLTKEIVNPKDFYEKVTIERVSEKVVNAILPLCIKGSPLFIIELTQSLLDQGLINIDNNKSLELTKEFKEMLELKDYSKIKIPFIIEKVLGNIIDSLKCMEIVILKHAAVIGNIFDIDILSDLLSVFTTTFDDLLEELRNFESFQIIEILYDLKPKHLVAMFAIPLMREVLYQRLLVEQKTDIHEKVAIKMEFSKYRYLPKNIESRLLERHLEASEQTIMRSIDENNNKEKCTNLANRKIKITKEIIEKLKIIELKITSSYHEIDNNIFRPKILFANIVKKDEHGGKKEDRYAILTNNKFCYYHNVGEYNDNQEPLASFELKDIYQITILSKDQFDEKNYYLEIKVSSWFKKNEQKEDRDFIIGFDSQEEMSKWEIALNFLRIKNMYDEFTSNFGMIQLPLNNEFSLIESKKFKRKLNIKQRGDNKVIDGNNGVNRKNNSMTTGKKNDRKKTICNILETEQGKETDKKNSSIVEKNAKEILKIGFGNFLKLIQTALSSNKNDGSDKDSNNDKSETPSQSSSPSDSENE